MDNEASFKGKGQKNNDTVVEINQAQENANYDQTRSDGSSRVQFKSFITTSPSPVPSPKPTISTVRKRTLTISAYSKPKSRIMEPPYTPNSKRVQENAQTTPSRSPLNTRSPLSYASPASKLNSTRTSAPITPRTPLMASIAGDDDEDVDDDAVYTPKGLGIDQVKRGRKVKVLIVLEWIAFVLITAVLVASLTVRRLEILRLAGLDLWKWCVFVLVIFCGRLFTEWLTNFVVFLVERNFLFRKKVLYFVFALRKSVRVVLWLGFILLAWMLLIDRGVRRSARMTRILNYVTRAIVSSLVGAVLWTVKTLLVKLVASKFHVNTYFDRIQESIFHQYILQALSGCAVVEDESSKIGRSRLASFRRRVVNGKKDEKGEVINVDKLYKVRREKVSAWTMGGLIKVIRNSELSTVSEVIDESEEEESGVPKVITSEAEAKESANRIFRNVAKPNQKYIDEDDLLCFMPQEEVDNALPLFEGAVESRRIKRSSFRRWVVKAYNERKCLAVTLTDAKTAIEELNKIASVLILVVIIIVWILLMGITSTRVLVFMASQLLVVAALLGTVAKSVFEAIIFIFVVHPFDVGDWCVIDGVQMIVDEMNLSTTIFLKFNNEKVYYPNKVLATLPISNYRRSPEMGDAVEFSVDFSTSTESVAALKAKIKAYIESKPQHWNPIHSVQVKEIVDVNKMVMVLYVTHTVNFQNTVRYDRRSELVFQLKNIFEALGIIYRLLPQEVHISYAGSTMPSAPTITR